MKGGIFMTVTDGSCKIDFVRISVQNSFRLYGGKYHLVTLLSDEKN